MRISIKQLKQAVAAGMTTAVLGAAFLCHTGSQAAAAPAPDGADIYKAKCAACHAADGSGATPAGKAMKVRDLGSADVQGQSDQQLYDIVAKGKGKMPAYEGTLGADTCKALVAHIREFKH